MTAPDKSVPDFMANKMALQIKPEDIEKIWTIQSKSATKPPLIGVRFITKRLRNMVLYESIKLHRAQSQNMQNIYINPDYTRIQMQTLAKLREEMKTARAAGKKVAIRNFQLVPILNASKQGSEEKLDTETPCQNNLTNPLILYTNPRSSAN